MPSNPPIELAISEVNENAPAPKRETTKPPNRDPTTIPIMMSFFLDMKLIYVEGLIEW